MEQLFKRAITILKSHKKSLTSLKPLNYLCFIVLTTGKAWKGSVYIKGTSLTNFHLRRELKREGSEGASLTWWMKTTEQRTEAMIAKIPNPIIREKPATIRSIAV